MKQKVIALLLLSLGWNVVVVDVALAAGKRKRTPPSAAIDLTSDDDDDDIAIVDSTGTKKPRLISHESAAHPGAVTSAHTEQTKHAASTAAMIDAAPTQPAAPAPSSWGQRLRAIASWISGYFGQASVAAKSQSPAPAAHVAPAGPPLSVPTVPTIAFENSTASTCFINASLQALLHTPAIINYASRQKAVSKTAANTLPNLYHVFNGLARATNTALAGKVLCTAIPQNNFAARVRHHFFEQEEYKDGGPQEDATEFLTPFFDQLPALKGLVVHGQKSSITCSAGHTSSSPADQHTILTMPIVPGASLAQCLMAYQHPEAGIEYKCNTCGIKNNQAHKKIIITQTSRVLLLEVRRHLEPADPVAGTPGVKDMRAIPFSPILILGAKPHAKRYALTAIICHAGSTIMGGHYIAVVRHMAARARGEVAASPTWLLCDDGTVHDCSVQMPAWQTAGVIRYNVAAYPQGFQPQIFVYEQQ